MASVSHLSLDLCRLCIVEKAACAWCEQVVNQRKSDASHGAWIVKWFAYVWPESSIRFPQGRRQGCRVKICLRAACVTRRSLETPL